jgi:hypothetical protein
MSDTARYVADDGSALLMEAKNVPSWVRNLLMRYYVGDEKGEGRLFAFRKHAEAYHERTGGAGAVHVLEKPRHEGGS